MSALLDAEARLNALDPKPYALPLGRLAPWVEAAFQGFGKRGWVLTSPRTRVGAVLRGCPVERLVDAAAGARPYRLAPSSGAPGSRALHAVGLALQTGEPVLCLLGLASAASGAFYEALNAASLTRAPVVFVLLRQRLDDQAPVGRQVAGSSAAVAAALGLDAHTISGAPDALADAVARAQQSGAPTLIESGEL